MIDDNKILVTGGTGSFGNTIVNELLEKYNPKEIVIFSRDEKKQFDMRNNINDSKLKFIIGDVRDNESVLRAMKDINIVFHAAALKQVPTCEFFPMEAVKTNIIGTNNVLCAAESYNIKKVVVLSTDKAVYPINVMGTTKSLLEKLMLSKARDSSSSTIFCGVRYGNVMYSRGSVLPFFVNQLKSGKDLTVTNPEMTRFLLPLPKAIDLVIHALNNGENGDMLVRKSPASTVDNIAKSMIEIFDTNAKIKIVGVREGEKMHETLVSQEELIRCEDQRDYFRIKNLASIDYDNFFVKGNKLDIDKEGYTSNNTTQLNFDDTKKLILSLPEIQKVLN